MDLKLNFFWQLAVLNIRNISPFFNPDVAVVAAAVALLFAVAIVDCLPLTIDQGVQGPDCGSCGRSG